MAFYNIHDQWLGDVMPQSGVSVAIGRNTADILNPAEPCIEANSRLLMLHDTLGSGIVSYQDSDLRLELIPAPSGTQSIVTAVYIDVYLNSAGTTAGFHPGLPMDLDTVRSNNHPEIFAFASDAVQINMPGVYVFEFAIGVDEPLGTTRHAFSCSGERQAPGGSFVGIPGTYTNFFTRNATTRQDARRSFILDDVAVGERFRVNVGQNVSPAGIGIPFRADACSLTVRKLA